MSVDRSADGVDADEAQRRLQRYLEACDARHFILDVQDEARADPHLLHALGAYEMYLLAAPPLRPDDVFALTLLQLIVDFQPIGTNTKEHINLGWQLGLWSLNYVLLADTLVRQLEVKADFVERLGDIDAMRDWATGWCREFSTCQEPMSPRDRARTQFIVWRTSRMAPRNELARDFRSAWHLLKGYGGDRKWTDAPDRSPFNAEEFQALVDSAYCLREDGVSGLVRKRPDGTYRYDPRGLRNLLRTERAEYSNLSAAKVAAKRPPPEDSPEQVEDALLEAELADKLLQLADNETDRGILALIQAGLTFEFVGETMNVSKSTVHRRMAKLVERAGLV